MTSSQLARGYVPDPLLAKSQMQEIVKALNPLRIRTHEARQPHESREVVLELSPMQTSLRQLVACWIESGPALAKFFKKHRSIARSLETGKTRLYATSAPNGYLEWEAFPARGSHASPADDALAYFAWLITNPQCLALGGPCRRCGNYYLKKTVRQKTYCSRRCGSFATAVETVERSRAAVHDDKLQKAQAAIQEWHKRKRRKSWKHWVAGYTGLTLHWITRAVNEGTLIAPDEPA